VYKVEVTFKAGAVFGDTVHVLTRVEELVHLVCLDAEKQFVRLPPSVLARLPG
jgi:acyl-CoA thioesterase FadM